MSNLEANLLEEGITVEDSYDSPYDYKNNSLLYCCTDLPNPKEKDNYLESLVNKIKELIILTHGKL